MSTVRRGLVLLLAYLVSALAASLAVVILAGFQQSVVLEDQLKLILPFTLILAVPVAWIPLTLALALALRLWRSRLLASLGAGVLTAFVLLVWQGNLVDRFLSVAVSPMDPPLWRQILQDLPAVFVVGLLGGAAFWAIAYRGLRPRPG